MAAGCLPSLAAVIICRRPFITRAVQVSLYHEMFELSKCSPSNSMHAERTSPQGGDDNFYLDPLSMFNMRIIRDTAHL